jgi:2'-5' RNA ligase
VKYFVAHLLSDDARRYHERLTRELAQRFKIVPLHERVPPHLTVKIPFEASEEEVADLERVLRAFARTHTSTPLELEGFGHFGFRTVYLDVKRSRESILLVRECIDTLKKNAPWMSFGPLEGNKLHASVARFLSRRQFQRMWKLLKTSRPHFHTTLDNLTILKKDGARWIVHANIPLPHDTVSWQEVSQTSSARHLLV